MEFEPTKLEIVGLQSIEITFDKESQYLIIAQMGDGTTHHSSEALSRMGKLLEGIIQEMTKGVKVKILVTDVPLSLDFYRLKPGE